VALIIITVLSLLVAVVMSVVAWRLAREERRRSEARVARLAADIHGEGASPVGVSDRFFADGEARTPVSPLRALAIGVVVVGSLVALVVFASGSRGNSVAAAPTAAPAPAGAPLELVTLGHQFDGDRLIVRGVVRHAKSTAVPDLTAVVSVFNRQGDIAASGQAFVTSAAPASAAGAAGVESTFVVTVPGVRDVARYRVAFKSNDRIIAHIDRRDHGVTAELP
jgi:hypothetical protein